MVDIFKEKVMVHESYMVSDNDIWCSPKTYAYMNELMDYVQKLQKKLETNSIPKTD